jgi:hypothetical protein
MGGEGGWRCSIHTPNMVSEMGIILSSIPLLYGQNEVTERESISMATQEDVPSNIKPLL